jgi:hypothetical protein
MQCKGISEINTSIRRMQHHNPLHPSPLFQYLAALGYMPVTTYFVYDVRLRETQYTKQISHISMGRLRMATIAINVLVLTARVRRGRRSLSTAAAVSDRSGGMKFYSMLWLKML